MKQGNDSWDFPHAFYLDAADTDGGIRVGTAENGFGPSEVTCAHVKWTDCTSDLTFITESTQTRHQKQVRVPNPNVQTDL